MQMHILSFIFKYVGTAYRLMRPMYINAAYVLTYAFQKIVFRKKKKDNFSGPYLSIICALNSRPPDSFAWQIIQNGGRLVLLILFKGCLILIEFLCHSHRNTNHLNLGALECT
jgi:hypothetical protein